MRHCTFCGQDTTRKHGMCAGCDAIRRRDTGMRPYRRQGRCPGSRRQAVDGSVRGYGGVWGGKGTCPKCKRLVRVGQDGRLYSHQAQVKRVVTG